MAKKDVVAAFPGEAQQLPQPVPFSQPQEGSSLPAGSSDLALPAYEADGATFRVLFGFDTGGLNRIHLSAVKPGAGTCGDVESALTAKHSAPAQRASTGTSLRGEQMTWKLPDQTIVLSCSGVASLGFLSVSLDYLAPSGELAKN
jgi:hypothetical protein